MLYDFAVTPEVFERDVLKEDAAPGGIVLQLLRGMIDNGTVANLDQGRWLTQVMRSLREGVAPSVRDRVLTCLAILDNRNRLIRRTQASGLPPNDEFRWLNWALECHAEASFHAIFLTEELLVISEKTDEVLVSLPEALDSQAWLNRRTSVTLVKSMSDYRRILTPVLRYAQVVRLIDPFLSPHKERFFRTIEVIADLLGYRGSFRRAGRIELHAGDPESEPTDRTTGTGPEPVVGRLDAWEVALQPVASHWGHYFRVFLWRNKPASKIFHDRYIITDQCGISTPGGIDCVEGDRANNTEWSLLDFDQLARRLRDFHHTTSPYKYLGMRDVQP